MAQSLSLVIPLQSLTHVVQHLPIPVVVTDDAGFVVATSSLATALLHSTAPTERIHLGQHLEALAPSSPAVDRTPIQCDSGMHDLVVLGAAHKPVPQDVATLAGEIAHDFNNLLGVIINYTTLAATDAPSGSQQARDLAEVLAASRRAAVIADRLRRMSTADALD